MQKVIYILLALTILSGLSFVWFLAYQEYSRDLVSLQETNMILTQEKTELKTHINTLESQNTQNNMYLTYSGTLHYIALDGLLGSWVLITESYDAVRFHNITTSPVVLDIYDSADISTSPITRLDIGSGSVSFFALKKSGIYTYILGEQKWSIIIGREYLEKYNLDSFLRNEIFPLFDQKDQSSIKKALLHFKEITMNNTLISKNCHNLAHEIGHDSFEKYGFSVAITGWQDDVCAWGYTHWVLESYFQSEPRLSEDPESACSTIAEKEKGSCFHWVGHGLMFISANNVETSLAWCHMLSTSVYKNRCAEWVFMELYSWDPKHALGKIWYSTWELFAPCDRYGTGSEWYVCWFYAGLGYLRYASEDYSWALEACHAGWFYADMCIRWVGREIAKRYIGDALRLETLCDTLSTATEKTSCISGGVNYTKLQFADDEALISGYCRWFQSFGSLCTTRTHWESVLTWSWT